MHWFEDEFMTLDKDGKEKMNVNGRMKRRLEGWMY